MYELINNVPLQVKEYNGQRVVTFKDIDTVHGRPEGTAKRNFNKNRKHFIEGVDFFKITPDEFRTAIGYMDKRQQNDITLVTESGYLMVVKSFTDDLSWNVQRLLVNSYFKANPVINPNPMNSVQYNDYISRENALALWEQQTKLESYVSTLEKRIAELENQRTSLPAPAETFYFTNEDDEYHIKEFLNSDKVQICPCGQVQASKLYAVFQEWCKENNVYCCTIAMFGTRIKKIKGITKRKTSVGTKYTGLRIALE